MFDNPIILNLHVLLWDSYIAVKDVRPPFAVEDRRRSCGYPPSFARSQKIGNGTLGLTIKKNICLADVLFCVIHKGMTEIVFWRTGLKNVEKQVVSFLDWVYNSGIV